MKGDIVKSYDLEEYSGEWELFKQFDTKEEAEQELKFYKKYYNHQKRFRIVERKYKILFEAK